MTGVVSVPVQSFVYSVKGMGDRTVPCGEPVEVYKYLTTVFHSLFFLTLFLPLGRHDMTSWTK